ncbi:MAG: carboxypeptidase-like regulatory domain-containing protein, partial [Candidatus Hydrothermarchaeaceae archaeon]
AFYMVFAASFYLQWFEAITIAGIFLTGFLDEVIRELSRIKKLSSLPRALARHSDLLLVFGILYVFMLQPYALFTSLNVGESTYLTIGILMLFGVLVADLMARKMEKREPGLESRAERMFLFTGFLLLGLYFTEFPLAIFVGLAGVTTSLCVWIFWRKFNFLHVAESLYGGLLGCWKRVSAGGSKISIPQKLKSPASIGGKKGEDFQEYSVEEYGPDSGYNFTAVVNDRGSEPLSNVKVSLLNVETDESYTGYTDPSGRASFSGIAEGQYNIVLECDGYKKTEFERYVSMDSGEVFVLKRPFSDLSIVISDKEKTTPVPNARVSLRLPGKGQSATRRTADNLGVAYFDELDINTYEIHVKAEGYDDWERSINLEAENVVSVNLELVGAGPVKIEAEVPDTQPKIEEELSVSEIMNGSGLLEYSSPEDVRAVVSQMVKGYKSHDRDVFLASTPERVEGYADLEVNIVDVPADPDRFKDVLERMPAGSVLIFEPLSNLILTGGFAAAFKFVSKTREYMEKEGLSLVCCLNPSAHDKKEVEKLRGLLESVVRVEGEKIFRY